jgi:hypothetical protein
MLCLVCGVEGDGALCERCELIAENAKLRAAVRELAVAAQGDGQFHLLREHAEAIRIAGEDSDG